MIVKMKKVAFSCDNKRRGKNTGSLTNHILYLITDKKSKRYSSQRCDLSFTLNPTQPDLGLLLKHEGKSLTHSELSDLVNEYCLEQHKYLVQHYVKNSRKAKQLDKYDECLTPQKLFNYQGSLSFTQDEYQRLLKASNNNQEHVKQAMTDITRHYLANYYNQIKKEQKIKDKKTKPEEIELITNFHIENENNPHIHFYTHAFNSTKRYMNPRYFSETKQIAHKQIERQFPLLEQGVAEGKTKQVGLNNRKNYLSHQFDQSNDWKQVRGDFRALEQQIYAILQSNGSVQIKVNALQQMGIFLSVFSNNHVEIKQEGINVTLDIESFINRSLKRSLQQFAKQWQFEKKSQRFNNPTIQKMETVLLNNLSVVNKALKRELDQLPPSQHNQAKKDAFSHFYQRCLSTGVIVNLNKQKHLSFHKLDKNHQSSVKATKYNASLFNSKALSGKAIVECFNLNIEDILQHQTELFNVMPKTLNYRKTVFVNVTESINDIYQEHFQIQRYERLFDYFSIEQREEGNHTTLFNEKGFSLIDIERIDEKSALISINMFHTASAAKLLSAILLEEAKSIPSNRIIVISPTTQTSNVDDLRHLHVELLFSTDKHNEKIRVSYQGMEQDKKLQTMIEKRLETELKRFEKNVQKYSKKKPESFRFTNATGLHLLDSTRLSEAQRAKVKRQIEAQKHRLKERIRSQQPSLS